MSFSRTVAGLILILAVLAVGAAAVLYGLQLGGQDSNKAAANGAPEDIIRSFLAEVSDGDLEAAARYSSTSTDPEVSDGLRDVVEQYELEKHTNVSITATSTRATTSRVRGEITRADDTRVQFFADLFKYKNDWIIDRFIVLGDGAARMSDAEAKTRGTETLAVLADAMAADSYTSLYDHIGRGWRRNTSASELHDAYEALSQQEQQAVIAAIRNTDPRVSRSPSLNQRGDIQFELRYDVRPDPLAAQLIYQRNEGEWKPVSINLKYAD